jgi:hypothetical protein
MLLLSIVVNAADYDEKIEHNSITISQDVNWTITLTLKKDLSSLSKVIDVPLSSKSIKVYINNNGQDIATNVLSDKKQIDLKDLKSNLKEGDIITIEYTTPGPILNITKDSESKKEVLISDKNEIGYTDIQAYYIVPKSVKNVKIFDSEGKNVKVTRNLDKVYWVVPHLSEQIYTIIYLTSAEKLDYTRLSISDVFEFTKEYDNQWVGFNNNEWLRVSFNVPLDNTRDITLVAKGTGKIEFYEFQSNTKLSELSVNGENWYKYLLTNFTGLQDTFDLKMVGDIQVNYVTDPQTYYTYDESSDKDTYGQSLGGSGACNNPSYMVDGLWSTYGSGTASGGSDTFICKYFQKWVKPANSVGAKLQDKLGNDAITNTTISSSCWNYDALNLNSIIMNSGNSGSSSSITYCANGSNWNASVTLSCNGELQNTCVGYLNDGINSNAYESAIYWLINNVAPSTPSGSSLNSADNVGEELAATGAGSTDSDSFPSAISYRYQFNCDSVGGTLLQALSTDNSWVITSTCGVSHTVYVSIYAYDGDLYSAAEVETVLISNLAPTFSATLTTQSIHHNANLSYDIDCTDTELDTIYYFDNTTLFDINVTTGMITDDPTISERGNYSINITCGDLYHNTSSTFLYRILDDAPTLQNYSFLPSINDGTQDLTFSFNATDTEGDSITNYSIWYRNNTYISAWDNLFTILNGNFSADTNLTIQFRMDDGTINTTWTNYTYSMNDSVAPIISNISVSSSSIVVNNVGYLYANCLDSASTVKNVIFGYTDATSTSHNSTLISINKDGKYSYSIAFNTIGTWYYSGFWCYDEAGNVAENSTVDIAISVTSSSPPVVPGGGGGSSTPDVTEQVQSVLNETVICGNGICQEGENPLTCPEDCPLNIEEVLCFIGDKDCQAWVFNLYILIIGGLFIYGIYISQRKRYK